MLFDDLRADHRGHRTRRRRKDSRVADRAIEIDEEPADRRRHEWRMQRAGQLSRHDQCARVVSPMRVEQRGLPVKQCSIARRDPVAAMLAGYKEGIARHRWSPEQFGQRTKQLTHPLEPFVATAWRRAVELCVAHVEYYPAAPHVFRTTSTHPASSRYANTTVIAKGPVRCTGPLPSHARNSALALRFARFFFALLFVGILLLVIRFVRRGS